MFVLQRVLVNRRRNRENIHKSTKNCDNEGEEKDEDWWVRIVVSLFNRNRLTSILEKRWFYRMKEEGKKRHAIEEEMKVEEEEMKDNEKKKKEELLSQEFEQDGMVVKKRRKVEGKKNNHLLLSNQSTKRDIVNNHTHIVVDNLSDNSIDNEYFSVFTWRLVWSEEASKGLIPWQVNVEFTLIIWIDTIDSNWISRFCIEGGNCWWRNDSIAEIIG